MAPAPGHVEALAEQGVLVVDLASAVADHADLVGSHIASDPQPSSGLFIHVPAGVDAAVPVDIFTRARAERVPPAHRTLVIVERGSSVQLLHGCSSPMYTPHTKRTDRVDLVVGPHASVTHTALQNWAANAATVATRRATVDEGGSVDFIEITLGAHQTATSIGVDLVGTQASGRITAVALAGPDQHHHLRCGFTHRAPETGAALHARAVAFGGGRISGGLETNGSPVSGHEDLLWHGLQVDDRSTLDLPSHAHLAELSADQRFQLRSRGLTAAEATVLAMTAFTDPIARSLPMEYAVEWERVVAQKGA